MKKFNKSLFCFLTAFLLMLNFCGCEYLQEYDDMAIYADDDDLVVRYVNVGQADCQVIQFPDGRNAIIDAGKNDGEDKLVRKLQNMGIEKFDFVIATHPHEDHIGGMDAVIENFEIGCVYLPDAVSTTVTFERMIDSITVKNVSVKKAKAGVSVIDDEYIKMVFVAPCSDEYNETNDYSAVLRLTFKDRSFLFTGDAEKYSEKEMLENGMDLQADVLKVGHHGSSTSSGDDFLYAVNPIVAIISVGDGNDYGHPHSETLDALEYVETYRTDLHGDITLVCDGTEIEIYTEYN